jgi:dynein intermediate chain 2, axonemal
MVEPVDYRIKRREFEKPCAFEDTESKLIGASSSDESKMNEYIDKNPSYITLDNIPILSTHEVNTERLVTQNRNMKHLEGGWPMGTDYAEEHETTKWRTKQLKEPSLSLAVRELAALTEKAIKQNNQIDMFEEYFLGENVDHSTETLTTKTLMLFKDPNEMKRSANKIAWNPESPGNKLAVAYSIMRFQQMPDRMPVQSYIWDMSAPNTAFKTIQGPSPLCTMAFNTKYTDFLVGGCYNGVIAVWDMRETKNTPNWQTQIEKSHHEPVYDIYWLHGKSGNEFVSASTDGRMMWWDFRKDKEPIDSCKITDGIVNPDTGEENVLGGTCLEYNPEAGATKYLAGTEQGIIIQANKKPQKAVDISHRYGLEGGKHHGPIYAIQRNPEESKCFLTVGDWTAKIWSEDISTPIMTTKYHDTYLTDGCWSPTRPGIFFLTQMDGWMHIWDYHYRQNEIAYSHKVGDSMLTTINVQNTPNSTKFGSLVAIGDSEGTITLIELCESLYEPQSNEKLSIKQMLEREYTREKNLKNAKRSTEGKKNPKKDEALIQKQRDKINERITKIEVDFFAQVGVGEEVRTNRKKEEENPVPQKQKPLETVQKNVEKDKNEITVENPVVTNGKSHEVQSSPESSLHSGSRGDAEEEKNED